MVRQVPHRVVRSGDREVRVVLAAGSVRTRLLGACPVPRSGDLGATSRGCVLKLLWIFHVRLREKRQILRRRRERLVGGAMKKLVYLRRPGVPLRRQGDRGVPHVCQLPLCLKWIL